MCEDRDTEIYISKERKERRKEGNVLFNNPLKTFYLRLYGVGHMEKDHSDSERGNPWSSPGLIFPISSKTSFICTMTERTAHIMVFVIPVVEHWLVREIALWVHPMKRTHSQTDGHKRKTFKRKVTTLLAENN